MRFPDFCHVPQRWADDSYYLAFNLTLIIQLKPVTDWLWAGEDSSWQTRLPGRFLRRPSSYNRDCQMAADALHARPVPAGCLAGCKPATSPRSGYQADQHLGRMPTRSIQEHQCVFVGLPPGNLCPGKGRAGVSACGRVRLFSSPSCGRQPDGAQPRVGSLIRPNQASSSNTGRSGWCGCPTATKSTLAWGV